MLPGILAFAVAKLIFHTLTNHQYGFHRDELATLSDARHLAWGYVAYPPLTPFLGRLELMVFGTSLTGFRFLAAAAQSVAIVVAAAIARTMGGNRAAQWITAGAVAIAPISIAASSLFQYVSFDYLWWVLLAYFVTRMVESDNADWWIAIGTVIGLGVLTKYTIAFCVAGLVIGVFASPLRAHLRRWQLWTGAAISILIALPHFVWQASNHFVTLDFLRSIHERDVRIGRTDGFFLEQLLVPANVVTVPIWVIGLAALFFSGQLRRYRILGWMAVTPFALFALAQGRSYYMAPAYPMLLAAGAVHLTAALEQRSSRMRRLVLAATAFLLVIGSGVALVLLPLAPIGSPLANFAMQRVGDLKEEVGWPELTAEVARIWKSLPPDERARTAIFCSNYGEAGAIDLYGPAHGLPNAISGVNSFWARGYGSPPPETVIFLGSTEERVRRRFADVQLAGRIPNPYGLDNEEAGQADIFLCRKPRVPWPELWQMLRSFG